MKRTLMAVAGGVAAFVLLTGFGPGGCGRAPDPGERFARAQEMISRRVNEQLDELKATPDQRAKILAIEERVFQQAKAKLEGGAAQRTADRAFFIQQLTSDAPDTAALYAKADAKADEMRAIARQAIDALVEVNQVLTPPQRAQLRAKLEALSTRQGGFGPPGMDY